MPRVKINEPDQYLFKATIRTRVTDLNYGGHVGNDTIFSFMHDARVQFIKAMGYTSELDIEGLGIIQADAAISYKAEIFAHQSIDLLVGIDDRNKFGFDLIYKFVLSDGSLAAIGKTGIVFYDYQKRKLSPAPSAFFTTIDEHKALL